MLRQTAVVDHARQWKSRTGQPPHALEQRQADRGETSLRPKHVWSIRTRLLVEGRIRDLAQFNLAIDSKLRGCDVVAIKVEDVAPNGYTMDRATVRQKKTGRPVKFELTDQTRQAVDYYLKAAIRSRANFYSRVDEVLVCA